MNFKELNLSEAVLSAVQKAGYTAASPIQEKAIPAMLEGRDLLACAQTGTGKTAAFALPVLDRLEKMKGHLTRALVLTPTRELAVQIFENFKKYGRYKKLRACCIYGGASLTLQRKALREGCDILIATPGRLADFLQQGEISLANIQIFVLDEADRMLDMGFIKEVEKFDALMPERQNALFSATMPKEIEALAKRLLKEPIDIRIAPTTVATESVHQELIFVRKDQKKALIEELLKEEELKKVIVFTRTKVGADRLVKYLERAGIGALALHGNKTQGQRMNALQRFRTNQVRVLVATDVAARGIDIHDVSHVINFDLPEEAESYVHRIGRSGRAGKEGSSLSFCSEGELVDLAAIEKLLGREIPLKQTMHSIELQRQKPLPKKVSSRRRPQRKEKAVGETNIARQHRDSDSSTKRSSEKRKSNPSSPKRRRRFASDRSC